MLVPAWKNVPQPGNPPANHYLCYRAQGGPPPLSLYHLEDEWRKDLQHPGPLEYLCAPSLKQLIPTRTTAPTWGRLKSIYC